MGYIKHDAIIVTSPNFELLQQAVERARDLGLPVMGPGEEVTNCYQSILVGPDGSKEGWERSDTCDTARDGFVAWLEAQRYEDLSNELDWVEVRYGGDDPELTAATRFNGFVPDPPPNRQLGNGCDHSVTVERNGVESCAACKVMIRNG